MGQKKLFACNKGLENYNSKEIYLALPFKLNFVSLITLKHPWLTFALSTIWMFHVNQDNHT